VDVSEHHHHEDDGSIAVDHHESGGSEQGGAPDDGHDHMASLLLVWAGVLTEAPALPQPDDVRIGHLRASHNTPPDLRVEPQKRPPRSA
jgi:hypothetical protein